MLGPYEATSPEAEEARAWFWTFGGWELDFSCGCWLRAGLRLGVGLGLGLGLRLRLGPRLCLRPRLRLRLGLGPRLRRRGRSE